MARPLEVARHEMDDEGEIMEDDEIPSGQYIS